MDYYFQFVTMVRDFEASISNLNVQLEKYPIDAEPSNFEGTEFQSLVHKCIDLGNYIGASGAETFQNEIITRLLTTNSAEENINYLDGLEMNIRLLWDDYEERIAHKSFRSTVLHVSRISMPGGESLEEATSLNELIEILVGVLTSMSNIMVEYKEARDHFQSEIKSGVRSNIGWLPEFKDIFKSDKAFEICKELLEELEITINGRPYMTKGKVAKLTAAITALKITVGIFRTDFTDEKLLKIFNEYLGTNYTTFSKKSNLYPGLLADAKLFLTQNFKK